MSNVPDFPAPIRVNNRLFFSRRIFERYKHELLCAHGLIGPEAPFREPQNEELVPAEQVARELGVNRRTLGRRIVGKKIEVA